MLQSASLAILPDIKHAFFTRTGGVSHGIYESMNGGVGSRDNAEHVAENRKRMALSLGVTPERFLSLYQIHSPDVVVATTPWRAEERPRADAVVTREVGLALGASTADCGPLLFADDSARVIGAAHSGWRGAFTGVIEATLAAMEKLGADRSNITVALGPTISQANYEVGQEFVDNFLAADADNARFFKDAARPAHAMFDLPAYIASRIAQAGVVKFEDLALCTYAEPDRFYSFRRSTHLNEPDYGRHINAITLVR